MSTATTLTDLQRQRRTETWRESQFGQAWRRLRRSKVSVVCAGFLLLVVIVALAAPLIAPYDPLDMSPKERFAPPSREHLCGTDEFGRDVCSRLMYGARISLEVGVISV